MPPASTLYLLTVRADNKGYINGNNERIKNVPGRHANVRVIDWRTESEQITAELCSDGGGHTHLSCSATAPKFYTNMILTAVGMTDKLIA